MKREIIPDWEELERHKKIIPEINPAAVIAMLGIKAVGEEIQQSILDVLMQEYHLSEGKFCALIVLHQHGRSGAAPSFLAEKIGVTRATISTMLQRLVRENMVAMRPDELDGRSKIAVLTEKGKAFMEKILPPHYLRVTKLMEKLTEDEQKELIRLLKKMAV